MKDICYQRKLCYQNQLKNWEKIHFQIHILWNFYLEALDRQVKKENENPSVGLLLCAAKNDEVVEYAMSRTMSLMLVSQYQLQLPDKAVLEKKLQQLVNIPQIED